jgi:hypothetical protein
MWVVVVHPIRGAVVHPIRGAVVHPVIIESVRRSPIILSHFFGLIVVIVRIRRTISAPVVTVAGV